MLMMPVSRGHHPPAQDHLTSARVANILGLSKRTLHNWVKSGRIPRPEVDTRNGYYMWTLGDVEAIRQMLKEESD